ncbi:MAG: hypothetical protein MJ168_05450 [Clostridia bacterium]|nr:hypothetical protein [Clostridia bacterium]
MAETNTANTSTQTEGAQTDPNTEGQSSATAADEKKYTDNELNNIVKAKSEKAVSKLMKELGITEKDKEKAKTILAQAAAEEAKNHPAPTGNADDSALQTELANARHEREMVILENVFLTSKVQPSKVEKAVRLIEPAKCRDEDGNFSREKAKAEVEALLKEWPELAVKADGNNVGFQIGSDGQTNNGGTAAKTEPQNLQSNLRSWNKIKRR